MAGRPPGLAPLGLNVSNSSLRTSMSTDLGASYNLTDEGIRLLSASAREFKLTSAGLKTTTRGDDASTPPADLSYRCSAKDLHVFDVIGSGAGGVVKKAVHVTTHRFVALKVMTVFDKDKRRQLVGEMRTLCDSPRQRGLVSFLGAYYSPETNQINIALEYVDGGSLESLVKRGDRSPSPSRVESPGRRRGSRVPPRATPAGPPRHQTGKHPRQTHGRAEDHGLRHRRRVGRDARDARLVQGDHVLHEPRARGEQDYGRSADVWSLGVTLLECALGRYPYDEGDGGPLGLMLQITRDDVPFPANHGFPREFVDLVRSCMRKGPGDRPTAELLRRHPFVARCAQDPAADVGRYVRTVMDPMEAIRSDAETFLAHYYRLVDRPAPDARALASLYRSSSCYTSAQGEKIKGGDAIGARLARRAGMGAGALRRELRTVDVLPGGVEGGMLILAAGTMEGRGDVAGGGGGGLRFDFRETFLVLQVHEGWDGMRPGGRKTWGVNFTCGITSRGGAVGERRTRRTASAATREKSIGALRASRFSMRKFFFPCTGRVACAR